MTDLTPAERQRARLKAIRYGLEQLPCAEIRWEADVWRRTGVDALAALCDEVLAERRAWDLEVPGGARGADLDALLARSDRERVARLVEDEAQPLVSALLSAGCGAFWLAQAPLAARGSSGCGAGGVNVLR